MKCLQEFPNKPQLKSHLRTCEGIETSENCQTFEMTRRCQGKDDEKMETTENKKESGLHLLINHGAMLNNLLFGFFERLYRHLNSVHF